MTDEIQKPKRKYKSRQPKVVQPPAIPAPPLAIGAQAQIDQQLAELIAAKPRLSGNISEIRAQLTLCEDVYARNAQQIQELIGLLKQLNGVAQEVPNFNLGTMVTHTLGAVTPPAPAYNPMGEIPPGVGSIPVNPRNPTPNAGGNVAAMVSGDGGFK